MRRWNYHIQVNNRHWKKSIKYLRLTQEHLLPQATLGFQSLIWAWADVAQRNILLYMRGVTISNLAPVIIFKINKHIITASVCQISNHGLFGCIYLVISLERKALEWDGWETLKSFNNAITSHILLQRLFSANVKTDQIIIFLGGLAAEVLNSGKQCLLPLLSREMWGNTHLVYEAEINECPISSSSLHRFWQ